jgi:hypothetical protein
MRYSHGRDTVADSNCDSHSYGYFDTNRNINANPDGYCNGYAGACYHQRWLGVGHEL